MVLRRLAKTTSAVLSTMLVMNVSAPLMVASAEEISEQVQSAASYTVVSDSPTAQSEYTIDLSNSTNTTAGVQLLSSFPLPAGYKNIAFDTDGYSGEVKIVVKDAVGNVIAEPAVDNPGNADAAIPNDDELPISGVENSSNAHEGGFYVYH